MEGIRVVMHPVNPGSGRTRSARPPPAGCESGKLFKRCFYILPIYAHIFTLTGKGEHKSKGSELLFFF